MIEPLLLGSGFAFAAAVQPGPLQAFLLSQVAARGWRRTLPAAFAPVVSDGPIALLALLVLGRLGPGVQLGLRGAGGVLLLVLAWGATRQARSPSPPPGEGKVPRTLLAATLVNVLNPNPYLGWTLVLGPALLAAWKRAPAEGVALVAAFYGTMVVALAATIVLFGTSRLLGARGRFLLELGSALTLAGLGVYQLAVSLGGAVALAGR